MTVAKCLSAVPIRFAGRPTDPISLAASSVDPAAGRLSTLASGYWLNVLGALGDKARHGCRLHTRADPVNAVTSTMQWSEDGVLESAKTAPGAED